MSDFLGTATFISSVRPIRPFWIWMTLVTNIRKFTVSRFVMRWNSESQITNNHLIYPLSLQLNFTSLAKESRVFTQCDIFCILRHKFSWCVALNLVWKYLFILQASKTTDRFQWISAISMLRKSLIIYMTTNWYDWYYWIPNRRKKGAFLLKLNY